MADLSLKRITVNMNTFCLLVEKAKCEEVADLTPYIEGVKDRNKNYKCNNQAVIGIKYFFYCGIYTKERYPELYKKVSWYQVIIDCDISQKEETVATPGIRIIDGIKRMNNIIKKHYTKEEKEAIFQAHEYEGNPEILHMPIKARTDKILKFNNCIYYDINGAYASELIKMFPKCAVRFESKYNHRHDNNNKGKMDFNTFVGCMTMNEKKKAVKEEQGLPIRDLHPKTRAYIVNNITQKMKEFMKKIGGARLYVNTDGFIVTRTAAFVPSSDEVGEFKIEYQGPVYTFQGKNYAVIQMEDKIIGTALPIELKELIDLRRGIVISYDRVFNEELNMYEYVNIQQYKMNIMEVN